MSVDIDGQRVAFLAAITSRHPGFVVWKHLDRALRGRGDIDAAAPAAGARAIADDAVRIAPELLGATHVITCHHVADKRIQFFVQPHRLPDLFELDVCLQPSRGLGPWASPEALLAVAETRPDGIRGIRPGAEAVISLVYHGLSPTGRDRLPPAERQIVTQGLDGDLDAARLAAATLPPRPARRPLQRLITSVVRSGAWDGRAARLAFAGFTAAAAAHPKFGIRRTAFRFAMASGRECTMSHIARHCDRRVDPLALKKLLSGSDESGHRIEEIQQ